MATLSPCCAVAVAALSEISEPPPSDVFPRLGKHPVLKNCREISHLGLYYVIEMLKLGKDLKPRRNVYLGVTSSHLVMVTMMGALSRALKLNEISKIVIDVKESCTQLLIVPAQVSGERAWGLQMVTCGYSGTRLLSAIDHARKPHTSGKPLSFSWRRIKSSEQTTMKKIKSQQKTLQHRIRELRLYGPDHVSHYEALANEYAEALRTDLEDVEETNIMAAELAARRLESQVISVIIAAIPAALESFFMAHVAILSREVQQMKIQDDILVQEIETIKHVHDSVRKQHSVSVAVLSSQVPRLSKPKTRSYQKASPEYHVDPYEAPSLSPTFSVKEETVNPSFDRSFLNTSTHSPAGVRSKTIFDTSASFTLKSTSWDGTDVETAKSVAYNLSRAGAHIQSYAWRLDGSLAILLQPNTPLPMAISAARSLGYECHTLDGFEIDVDGL
eukprot:TRINITY_DN27546_c0_g1_i1.p1 TRINITY_DN27546_c0_g1~~TRINITY_DN27546_c0_g1_i1.p1  ORF type:complete len:445 (+),score=52.59 TRINITY_DN27546_c0_g1_i1:100-1434(+)